MDDLVSMEVTSWRLSPRLGSEQLALFGAYLSDVVILTHHRCLYSMVLDCKSNTTETLSLWAGVFEQE